MRRFVSKRDSFFFRSVGSRLGPASQFNLTVESSDVRRANFGTKLQFDDTFFSLIGKNLEIYYSFEGRDRGRENDMIERDDDAALRRVPTKVFEASASLGRE